MASFLSLVPSTVLMVLLLQLSVSASVVPSLSDRRTATAIIHDQDGIWGSVVFHQWSPKGPVIMSMLFQNMKVSFISLISHHLLFFHTRENQARRHLEY